MTAPNKKIETLAEFKYKPVMSAWFAWKTGGTSTRYSWELRNTLKEIRYRGQLPDIDFDYGFQSLVELIEVHHKGKYNCARIYGHRNENENKMIRQYWDDKLDEECKNWPNFQSEVWLKTKDKLTQDLFIVVRNARLVTSVLNDEELK